MTAPLHTVRVVAGPDSAPVTLRDYRRFDLVADMLELADAFSFEMPFSAQAWGATRPDTEVQIFVDDSRVLTGFIDDRDRSIGRDGSTIAISGRDRGGRLRDESAALQTFDGLTLEDLVKRLVSPWFESVTFSNATNRDLIRGRGRRKAKAGAEPPILVGEDIVKKVEPGESRAGVLEFVLKKAGLLGWSTADGKSFFVGLPNHDQAAQWHFFAPKPQSSRWQETNVKTLDSRESVAERYSRIIVCGSGDGDSANYGANVTRYYGEVRDSQDAADGTGGSFQHAKSLIVPESDLKSAEQASERAEREMAVRDGTGRQMTLDAAGFGQALSGNSREPAAIFAFDTIARVEDEEAGDVGDWLVTRVDFRESKADGQTTRLSLVPRGTELRAL